MYRLCLHSDIHSTLDSISVGFAEVVCPSSSSGGNETKIVLKLWWRAQQQRGRARVTAERRQAKGEAYGVSMFWIFKLR